MIFLSYANNWYIFVRYCISHKICTRFCCCCCFVFCFCCCEWLHVPLHWRHNDHDGVPNHQPHGCLLNRLFRRRSKKTSKLRVTGLCVWNSPGPVNSPHKGPVTRKMFPFDDVIMALTYILQGWFIGLKAVTYVYTKQQWYMIRDRNVLYGLMEIM